jgi:hypothetical protein
MDHIAVTPEFREVLRALRSVAGASPEIGGSFPELGQSASDCFRVKDDCLVATGTGDLVITLEPTERMLEFVAAKRAREAVLHSSPKV